MNNLAKRKSTVLYWRKNPGTEQKILSKTNTKKKFDLCDIWKIRNPNTKRYTFRQQPSPGYIQRRFYYFFISNFYKNLWKPWNIITLYVIKVHTLIAWKKIFYLRKPEELKYYWWAECVGLFKMQNKTFF